MDINDYIKSMLAEGKTSDDIAKAFTTALNKVEKENKEYEHKNYINKVRTEVTNMVKNNNITVDMVGKVALLAANTDNWTKKKMDDYVKLVNMWAKLIAKNDFSYNSTRLTDAIDEFFNKNFWQF